MRTHVFSRRDFLRSISATFALLPTVGFASEGLSLDEILERHGKVRLGQNQPKEGLTLLATGVAELIPERFAGLKRIKGKATFSSKWPNKVRYEADFGNIGMVRGCDGKQGWLNSVSSSTPLEKKLKSLTTAGVMFQDCVLHDGLFEAHQLEKAKLKGMEKVGQRPAYVIEIPLSDGRSKVWVDAETFVRVKTEAVFSHNLIFNSEMERSSNPIYFSDNTPNAKPARTTTVANSSITRLEFEASDFREVQGALLPFTYIERLPWYVIQVSIRNYEWNAPLDDGLFRALEP